MFVEISSAILFPREMYVLKFPQPSPMRLASANSGANAFLQQKPETMLLSERLKNPDAYRKLQSERREMLLALLMANPSEAINVRILDLVRLICGEEAWSAESANIAFEDENHPAIDFQCVETAVLLGWTVLRLGKELDSHALNRIRSEVRRRVFKPIMLHNDYAFMRGASDRPIAIASDILVSLLLLESDLPRFDRLVRSVLQLLDEVCRRHGRELAALEDSVAEISAVTDLVNLIFKYTNGKIDLTPAIPTNNWLDELLFPWIQDDVFNNPAGSSMRPQLSGSDIFRVGVATNDDALKKLGANLHHKKNIPSATVTGRLLDAALFDQIKETFGKPQHLLYGSIHRNLLMVAQMKRLYCSLHTGGGRANAGDICLFSDSYAILTDGGANCDIRNLPVLAGKTQLNKPSLPCYAEFEAIDNREIMSVELTSAYPAECHLHSYQRTLLTLRDEQTIRLVDTLNFSQPESVTFRFVTAVRPAIIGKSVRFGTLRMTWEGELSASTSAAGHGLTIVELTSAKPVLDKIFTFNFECL